MPDRLNIPQSRDPKAAYKLQQAIDDLQAGSGGGGGGVSSVSGTAPIVSSGGTTPAISLADTAVTPNTYTNATVTVDQKGRITAASNGSGGSVATAYYLARRFGR